MKKPVGTILKLAAQNYVDRLPERLRDDAIKTLNQVFAAADTFNAEMDASSIDPTLTPAGRATVAGKTTTSALAALDAISAETQKLTTRATAIETALRAKVAHVAPTNPADRIAYESQLREIRDSLRGLSAAERLHVYRSSNDPLVLAAVESAPMVINANRTRLEPFLDPAEIATAIMARAEAADPATAQTLEETRSLAEVYRLAVGSVRAEINDAIPGGIPASV